jgi:transposase
MPPCTAPRRCRRPVGTAYKSWLQNQPKGFTAGVEQAALDPFRGYANAIRDELGDAVAVLDAFHVVRLGTQVVDEVRRRVRRLAHGFRDFNHYRLRILLAASGDRAYRG